MTSINLIGAQIRPLGSSTKGAVSFGLDNEARYRSSNIQRDYFTSWADKQKEAEGKSSSSSIPRKPLSIDSQTWYSSSNPQKDFFTSFAEKEAQKKGKNCRD